MPTPTPSQLDALIKAATAPWYERLAAVLFGDPFVSTSVDGCVKGYRWRDRIYITEYFVTEYLVPRD